MDRTCIAGIVLLLVIPCVFMSACTGPDGQETAPTVAAPDQAPSETAVAPATIPSLQAETTITVTPIENPARVFNGDYLWVEYRQTNSVTMPPNPRSQWVYNIRTERSSGVYKATPAVRYKTITTTDYSELAGNTVTVAKNGWIIYDDGYYDPSSDRFLGGTESSTIKGTEQPATDIPANQNNREDLPTGFLGIMPFGEMNITLTCPGTESVIVPAGTFADARKCMGSFNDGTPITFWIAPGVPVPVRYEFPYTYQDGVDPFNLYELKGWG